jgi:hypothetical protein
MIHRIVGKAEFNRTGNPCRILEIHMKHFSRRPVRGKVATLEIPLTGPCIIPASGGVFCEHFSRPDGNIGCEGDADRFAGI